MKTIQISPNTEHERIYYKCPGCKHLHSVCPKRWNWNGSLESPTFSPSVRHFYQHHETNQEITICHYFVKDGNIQFCGDCEHELKNQIVPLSELTENDLSSLTR